MGKDGLLERLLDVVYVVVLCLVVTVMNSVLLLDFDHSV